MISTRLFQGRDNLSHILDIRKEVLADKGEITDIYDDFAINALLYDDDVPAGTARLLFKEGRFFIDMVCVKNQFKGLYYEDLLIRLLVRKAVSMGAEKTYMEAGEDLVEILENIGFKRETKGENLMVKVGDVG
ncbi:MAG TPA: hypothetical protein GYA03_06250, partial [Tissierellia bacterium]|nr:hypothetical protein [Tissierellia bacterium]